MVTLDRTDGIFSGRLKTANVVFLQNDYGDIQFIIDAGNKNKWILISSLSIFLFGLAGGAPSNRLMGMCRRIWSHFYDWIDYNRVAFSIELLEWGRTFSGFWG